MALHSVEALLDATTDTAVRKEWAALAEAGLPSQAAHRGPTNAPHVPRAMSAAPDVPEVVGAGRWTPHVTLVRGLGTRQVGDALAVLGAATTLEGNIETVRRWDPTARRAWPVGRKPTMDA